MLTIKCQKNIEAARGYFDEHLAVDGIDPASYYEVERGTPGDLQAGECGGHWHGAIAKRLNLNGLVTKENFDALLEGKAPGTNNPLTRRRNKNGERRLYFDCVFSAPKSVSILGLTLDDKRLIHAHNAAIRETFKELEKAAHTRVRKGGEYSVRPTGELLASEFLHSTSRSLDPQLHTHLVVFNVTFDKLEGQFKALEAYGIYDRARYLTEVYRSILHKKVCELGYKTKIARHGFEIEGISQDVIELYSKRSQDIKKATSELELHLGRKLTNNELSNISHQTRDTKNKAVAPIDAIQLQLEQLSTEQKESLKHLVDSSLENAKKFRFNDNEISTQDAITRSCRHLFERRSVVKMHDILETALKNYSLAFDYKDLKKELQNRKDLIFDFDKMKVGSKEHLGKEWFITESVKVSKNIARENSKRPKKFEPEASLSLEQSRALNKMMSSKDKYFALVGAAGAGKSRLLKSFVDMEKNYNGRKIIATASTTKAKEALVEDYSVAAQTFQSLLKDPENAKKKLENATLIVDEAGMLSVSQVEKLMKISNESKNSRVVFVGDPRQHNSVEAGDALRILLKFGNIDSASLKEVHRQKLNKDYLEASQLATNSQGLKKSWEKLDKMNAIIEDSSFQKRKDMISDLYIEAKNKGQTALCVAPTWSDIDDLTSSLRQKLKEQETLKGPEFAYKTFRDLNYSRQEKLDIKNYVTNKKPLQVKINKQFNELETSKRYTAIVEDKNLFFEDFETKKKIKIEPTKEIVDSFTVGEERDLKIMKGDTLLIKENKKSAEASFINGDEVKVKNIDSRGVVLEDGRVIDPLRMNRIEHGYFMTSQLSQGLTKDVVFLHMSQNSGSALNGKFFHVGFTRARTDVKLIVEDKKAIEKKVTDIEHRECVLEMLGSLEPKQKFSTYNNSAVYFSDDLKSLYNPSKDFSVVISPYSLDLSKRKLEPQLGLGPRF